jgi:hypothetical protein
MRLFARAGASPDPATVKPLSTVPGRRRLALAYPAAVRDLRWAVAGLIVGTTLLTGCAEKVEANDTLPPTSAAKATDALPPMGPADFPVPAEARTKDAAGARAFLDYWVALLNRQQAIPDGKPIRDLGPDCNECLRIARVYDESAAAGRRYMGGELAVVVAAMPTIDGDQTMVSFTASEEAVQLVDPSGATVESLEADSDLSSGLTLTWSDSERGWVVKSMTLG